MRVTKAGLEVFVQAFLKRLAGVEGAEPLVALRRARKLQKEHAAERALLNE